MHYMTVSWENLVLTCVEIAVILYDLYNNLCHGRQVDQREKVVHKTSTAHFQLPIQHTCNQVINYVCITIN